ncbi:hypothetical protein QJS66_11895 [Kocuria rhizophila]|nr:hypothetical protein QJS66_11895 [Kocuria rhizophila]
MTIMHDVPVRDGHAVLDAASGLLVPGAGRGPRRTCGTPVTVGIRPESWEITGEGDARDPRCPCGVHLVEAGLRGVHPLRLRAPRSPVPRTPAPCGWRRAAHRPCGQVPAGWRRSHDPRTPERPGGLLLDPPPASLEVVVGR